MSEEVTTGLPFSHEEYQRRLAQTRAAMARDGIDTLVVSDPSNMNWLTGYDGWSFYVHQSVVVGEDGDPVWFGREQDAAGAARTTYLGGSNIVGYPDHYVQSPTEHPMTLLADLVLQRSWGHGRIGVEMDNYWFSAKAYAVLTGTLPGARFEDATALVNWLRAVKSPQELTYMGQAARLVERMHRVIRERCEPGYRKCDLVADIVEAGLRFDEGLGYGGDYPAIVPLLPSGADASAPHLTWDDKPLRANEGTFFEIAGVVRRYHCPLSRTVYLGQPPQYFLDAEKAVLEAMQAGLDAARPGNRCEDVAVAFFNVLERHGIEKNNRTGYPIGVSYPPDWGERTMSLRRGDHTVLQENMTFHFMSGLWMDGWGLETTESFVVEASGARCLANVPREVFVRS